MSSARCFAKNCFEKPVAICKGRNSSNYSCNKHINNVPQGHDISTSFQFPPNLDKQKLIEEAYKLKIAVTKSKFSIISKSSKAIEVVEKSAKSCLDELDIIENLIQEILKIPSHFCELNDINNVELLQNFYDYNLEFKKSWIIDLKKIVKNHKTEIINNIFQYPLNRIKLNDPVLYFHKNLLHSYDLQNSDLSGNNTELLTPETYSTMCRIPNDSLFIIRNKCRSEALIIDSNCNSKIISPGVKHDIVPSCVYLNGFVYVFGGLTDDGNRSPISKKYDIKKDKFIKIENLPEPSGGNSCNVYRNDILVTGLDCSVVYKYNVFSNNYSVILDVPTQCHKTVLTRDDFAFIICIPSIFQYNGDACVNYGSHECDSLMLDSIYYKDSFYFINNKFQIFKFNLKKRSVSCIHSSMDHNIILENLI